MGSEPAAAPVVVLDANLLYPFHLRNLFVQLGFDGIVGVRWTGRIHEEWMAALAATGRVTRERLVRTRDLMRAVLPGAEVTGWERHVPGVTLPDPDDRHVVAAAVAAGATAIVTFDLRDFPPGALGPYGLTAVHPDAFLCALLDDDADAVLASAAAAQANLSRSSPDVPAFAAALERGGLPLFAARLRGAGA